MIDSAALDTNILIYSHFSDYEYHKNCRSWLEKFLDSCRAFYFSWMTIYEYIRVTTHPNVLGKPLTAKQSVNDLNDYLKDPRCQVLQESDTHWETLVKLSKSLPSAKGNFIHDCHLAALLYEHGIKHIVTADSDFLKFSFLKVTNPVKNT